MPMYEYDCPGCGHEFEKRQPMAEADKAVCPHCGNTYTKRRLSRISIKGASTSGGSGSLSLPVSGSL